MNERNDNDVRRTWVDENGNRVTEVPNSEVFAIEASFVNPNFREVNRRRSEEWRRNNQS